MLLLQTHYRSPVKVGQDNIDSSVKSLANLDGFADRMTKAALPAKSSDTEVLAKFREVMDNDIDTPNAMAIIFDTVRRANIAIESGDTEACSALATAVHEMCNALGLVLRSGDDIDGAIVERAQQLDAARVAKDFATADAIRIELQEAGYVVETTKAGTRVRRA
jgi:cysteinyl-tRNA synthetase